MRPLVHDDPPPMTPAAVDSHRPLRPTAYLIRVTEAAQLTGLPRSLLRKSFMRDEKRPRNIPPPPPHKRIGRAVYILADELSAWVAGLNGGRPAGLGQAEKRRRGRPTVAERIRQRKKAAV